MDEDDARTTLRVPVSLWQRFIAYRASEMVRHRRVPTQNEMLLRFLEAGMNLHAPVREKEAAE